MWSYHLIIFKNKIKIRNKTLKLTLYLKKHTFENLCINPGIMLPIENVTIR